jgi:hypothetical protein
VNQPGPLRDQPGPLRDQPGPLRDQPGPAGELLETARATHFRLPSGEFASLLRKQAERKRGNRALYLAGAAVPALATVFFLRQGPGPTAPLIAPESNRTVLSEVSKAPASPEVPLESSKPQVESIEPPEEAPEARKIASAAPTRARTEPARTEKNSAPRADERPAALRAATATATATPTAAHDLAPQDASPALGKSVPDSRAATPPVEVPSLPSVSSPEPSSAPVVATRGAEVGVSVERTSAPQVPRSSADCQALVRAARYAEAATCQGARATENSGTTAELAFLNKARLELKALSNPELSLRTLAEYRRRFPGGVLTREAAIAESQAREALQLKRR